MNTATKVIGGIGIVTLIALGMRKKKTTTTSTQTPTQQVKTDYEGRLVVQDNGNWFVVKDGKRWFTGNVQAIMDFQAAYPGNNEPIQNVPSADLEVYPIAGSIQEGLNFVPTGGKLANPFVANFTGL